MQHGMGFLTPLFLMHVLISFFYCMTLGKTYGSYKAMSRTTSHMSEMKFLGESFNAKLEVMQENVLHHMEEEEKELLPQAEKKLGKEKLTDLGKKMFTRKEELKPMELQAVLALK